MKELLTSIKYIHFKFTDGTNLVVRTSLDLKLVPDMKEGCLYNLLTNKNIPLGELEGTVKTLYDEYPEQYREETEFYEKLLG